MFRPAAKNDIVMKKYVLTFVALLALAFVAVAQGGSCNNPIVVTSTEPFFEGFEGGVIPDCWTQPDSNWWTVGTGDLDLAQGTFDGNGNAKIIHHVSGSATKLVTPLLDLSMLPAAQLVFYQLRRDWSGDVDSLNILYRTSDTGSWQLLATFSTAAEVWTESVVALPNPGGTCQVAFEMVDRYGFGCGLDDIYIGAPRNCLRVQGLSTTSVTSNSITLVWQDTLNAGATYTISWWSDADDTLSTTVSDTTVTITGLGGSTRYHFSVVVNCSDGTNTVPFFGTFHTAVGMAHVPYYNQFNDYLNSLYGWTVLVNYAQVTGASLGTSGLDLGHVLNLNGTVALPRMDRPTDSLQVRFWMCPFSFYDRYMGTFSVGYMTDLGDMSTFVRVASWTNVDCFQYDERAVLMTGAPDSAYIVFRNESNVTTLNWYIDSLIVEVIPECTRPTRVAVTGATSSSIDLGISGLVDNYRVWWTDGTVADSADFCDSVYTITGLTPNTQYIISVATRCQDAAVTHPVTIRARTECVTLAVPYSENFEGIANGVTPYCWSVIHGNPLVYMNGVGGNMTKILVFSEALDVAISLPPLDRPTDSLQLRFWLFAAGDRCGTFSVGYMTDLGNDSTFVVIDSWAATEWSTFEYYEKIVPLCGVPGNAHIVLRAELDNANHIWGLDNLVVEPLPPCPAPTRLTVTGVGLDSIAVAYSGGCSENYRLYITDGVSYSDMDIATSEDSHTFNGLSQATRYTIGVVSDCSSDVSDTLYIVAVTQMQADTLPFYTGFEPGDDTLWRCVNGPSTTSGDPNRWILGSAVAYSGSRSIYITDDGDSNHQTPGVQPAVYFTNAFAYKTFYFDTGDYAIIYDWHNNDGYIRVVLEPSNFGFDARIMNLGTPTGGYSLDGGRALRDHTNWQTFSDTVTVDSAGYYHFVLYWFGGASSGQPPAAIDNISLYRVTCPVVRNLTVDSVAQGAASISWTPYGSESEWAVTVGNRTSIVSSPTYFCTGLTPTTSYTISVRPICGVGDTGSVVSGWFTTELCDGATVMQNYDSTYDDGWDSDYPFGALYSNYYSYAQTIFPASFMDTVGSEIHAFSFSVRGGAVVMPGVDVFMANIPDSNLDVGFIHPDRYRQFVHVIDNGDFSFSGSGIYTHSFDTNFVWDGHSNVLLAVRHNQPAVLVNSTLPSFNLHNCGVKRARDAHSSSAPIDITTATGGWASTRVADIYLISCPEGCETPSVTDIVADNESVTVWFSATDTVEAYITTADWDDNVHGALVPPGVGQYTFTGLMPMVHYNVGVRQVCNDSSYSPWVVYSVTTLDMGCLPPTGFTLGDADYDSQPFSWTPAAGELTWQIHVFNAFTNTTYNTTVIPATVGGLRPGTTYQASIRSLCGLVGDIPGPWGDTLTFTTLECPSVTGVSVSNVTDTSATVSWHPAGSSVGYKIYYGPAGFYDAEAEVAVVDDTATSYTIVGLNGATAYEAYVLNLCTPTVHSGVFEEQRVSFTTNVGIDNVDGGALVLYPNPTSNSVTLKVSGFDGPVIAQMVDMNGRVCGTWPVGGGLLIMDVSGFAPGAYFLRVTGANGTAVKKLVLRS